MYGTKYNLCLTSIKLHPPENWTSFIRDIVISLCIISFCKYRTETETPDPASDNTQGESVIFCKLRDNQVWKLLEIPNKTKRLFLPDKMFAF